MIQFYSTQGKCVKVSLEEAVMKGLADDGGLYMPEHIPQLPDSFFQKIRSLSFQEISFEVAKTLLQGAIPKRDLKNIIERAVAFDAPLVEIFPGIYSLELFHGPTLSFKDFGARFMAELMGYFAKQKGEMLNILAATSGDTGSAVAQAFLDVPNTRVWILYPKGKISESQEKQMTTFGQNIVALEVEGTFDDCQKLVKQAFSDQDLREKMALTSANSINIARLIPQTFYYFYAYAQLQKPDLPLIISVPCGNFGNLTAGLIAKRMGLPVSHFVAATNANDSVPKYLKTGIFNPQPSIKTLSNAMDVGNPSNFARMLFLDKQLRQDLFGASFSDPETESAMREVFEQSGYLLDPHGAVAYLGLSAFLKQHPGKANGIFLETADPAKFAEDVKQITGQNPPIPERLKKVLAKEKQTLVIPAEYDKLKALLCK
ncbi:MAG: threonine synthase [Parachlamydiales bacterium]|nr:threonine synthase [Parachlamydiales bacterium]